MSELRAVVAGRDVDVEGWPTVSVVMPIRDEARHLEHAVRSVLAQEYPRTFDVCLAIAPSGDGTEDVAAELAAGDDRVSVVPNPAGVTPAGLNAAIAATSGDVVVRVDGHAELSPGYIRRAVDTMVRTGAVNVGGRQVPVPETAFEEAVAAATTSWMGTGGARYRVGGGDGPVDTVYLGVFDRAAGDVVGWFDESLIRNQDYELNIRLRGAGGTIWFDPELWVGYRPRSSIGALARQYYEYGYWKAEVVARHPESIRLRQVLPALLAPAVAAIAVTSHRRVGRIGLIGLVGGLVAGWRTIRPRDGRGGASVWLVLPAMHLGWSCGAWRGAWAMVLRRRRLAGRRSVGRPACRASSRP